MINFHFKLAASNDIPEIMELMKTTKANMTQKEWFVDDEEEYLHFILNGHGFIIIAKSEKTEQLAAFFIIKFPKLAEDNLGRHLNFDEPKLEKCAHMDSCVVNQNFRGYHLQSKMVLFAEELLAKSSYTYLLATVHPDNIFSMNSMLRCGYHVVKNTFLYGGLPRAILLKQLLTHN